MSTLTLDEAAVVLKTTPAYEHALDVIAWAETYKPGDRAMISCLIGISRHARKRSSRAGRICTITAADVVALYYANEGRCRLSGMPFSLAKIGRSAKRPFAPSIDRINSAKGYTRGNVRLVCCAINLLMNEWGDEVFHELAGHIRKP